MTNTASQYEIKQLQAELAEREQTRESLYRNIARLDGSDPEDGDAARDWSSQARYQDERIAALERIIWQLEEIAS